MSKTHQMQDALELKRRGRLHGVAVEALRAMIASGRFAPGVPLREKELCVELGISRSPLREAIRTLAREGLVRLTPNCSAVAFGLDYGSIESLYEAVSGLESLAAKLTLERATDQEIDEIRALHHQIMVHYFKRDLTAYIQANIEIHRSVMRLSRNSVLLECWDLLLPRVERARTAANLHPDRWHAAVLEHERMLSALTARVYPTFSELIRHHYLNGLMTLKAAASAEPRSPE
jgi:DNA-binding GntR family transcriptional regulator